MDPSWDPDLLHEGVAVEELAAKGRGLVAFEEIDAGEMILCETSLISCQDDLGETVRDIMLNAMLPWAKKEGQEVEGSSTFAKLNALHPTSLEDSYATEAQQDVVRYMETLCDVWENEDTDEEVKFLVSAHRERIVLLALKVILHINPMTDLILANSNIAFQVTMNAFGSGLYLWISMLNHSCKPNCEAVHSDGVTHIVSNRRIEKGSELTIRYGPAEDLLTRYGFTCVCDVCISGEVPPTEEARRAAVFRSLPLSV